MQADVAEVTTLSSEPTMDSVNRWVVYLYRSLRPSDGWIALILLATNMGVVIWSVQHANWVPTPNLGVVLFLAMFTGLLLYRVPLWGILVFPVGLGIGFLVVVWQMTSFSGGTDAVTDAGQLWERLELWFSAAKAGSINIDQVPFATGVVAATWLAGYVAVWLFARHRNFWGVFIMGGILLLTNLTYLPPSAGAFLFFYLFTAMLLVGRVLAVRRRREWTRRNIIYDSHLGALSMSDTLFLALPALLIAFLAIPVGNGLGSLNRAYEYMRSPTNGLEDDFNRLFAGLPARRPLGYRIWGDVMAFQGTIRPTTTRVLQVNSPLPMYTRARTYGTYTPKGWVSVDTTFESLDWVPSHAAPEPAADRFEVAYSVLPGYSTNNVFAGGRLLNIDREVKVETYHSPTYRIDIHDLGANPWQSPMLADTAQKLNGVVRQRGVFVDSASLASVVPPGLRLLEVERIGGEALSVTLVDVLSDQPDVLSVRSVDGKIDAGETYQVLSSISLALPDDLRQAGTDYPAWAVEKYTQLPEDLPQRVRTLGAELTAGAPSPYEKAKAVESYLRDRYPYELSITPPPFDADGVDHFLFNEKQGYSEYFASSMAVLLRSVDIPARVVTGYTVGEKVPDEAIYLVRDSNSHAWVEVYFPRQGWIDFEPTPCDTCVLPQGALLQPGPAAARAGNLDVSSTTVEEDCYVEIEECGEFFGFNDAFDNRSTDQDLRDRIIGYWPLMVGGIAALTLALAAVTLFWRRYLVPSDDPQTAYRRLAFLGALGATGPHAYETPFQYRERLRALLPSYRDDVNTLVDAYVRSEYGAKQLAEEDREGLIAAWLRLRTPLVLRILRMKAG